MFDLTGSDTECERAECAVGRCVRVTADDGQSWLRQSQLWSNDMDDSLLDITE